MKYQPPRGLDAAIKTDRAVLRKLDIEPGSKN